MIGFGTYTYPVRRAAPASAPVEAPLADFGGLGSAWQKDWQQRYDKEEAKRVDPHWVTGDLEIFPGAPDYSPFNAEIAGVASPYERGGVADVAGKPYRGGSHRVRTEWLDLGVTPDFTALNAERDQMGPFAEQQMRQQQAYDWMQGGQQENALMSPDYANAGFNTITGMSNPYAGPAGIEGIGMDWAQGVYDPTTQRGTGTYQPTYQRTGFGW